MSDSDSSPKSSSSSSSSSRGAGEGKAIRAAQTPASPEEDSTAYGDPGSPSKSHQSSDESGSSDGVLVELPGKPDQESRALRRDQDSGILVNIDGSMQESPDEGDQAEDTGREETFEDASDNLAVVGGRAVGLEESMAVIEIGESSAETPIADDFARVQAGLEDSIAECRKYKEEREVFGREVLSLRRLLQAMIDQKSLLAANNDELIPSDGSEEKALSSATPLHSMLDDCSNYLLQLRSALDEQLNSQGTIRELHAVLYVKDQEIEDLHAKVSESSVSRDVILSYLGSLWETSAESLRESSDIATRRLLASLASVVGPEHVSLGDSPADVISLVETNILLLMEKQRHFLSEIQQLGECFSEVRSDFSIPEDNEFGDLFKIIRGELVEGKRRETLLKDRIGRLEEDNKKLAVEHEQSENKLAATREKLSMAVTKGKSLVHTRDSLKQSLAEKTNELERCMLELQQRSDTLRTTEANAEELNRLLVEKTTELERCMQELQEKSEILESTEGSAEELKQILAEKTSELERCMQELQEKSEMLQSTEGNAEELKQILAEKTGELERCMLELQQKSETLQTIEASAEELKQLLSKNTGELERCMLELQQKSDGLQSTEASAEELKQLLAKNMGELERCMLELQQKSDALQTSEASTEELKHLLAKKTSEHESCMLELQKKSDASQTAEASAEELKQILAERTSELEKCLVELQQKSGAIEIAKVSAKEMTETNNLVTSLRDLLSQRDKVLQEIEEVMLQSDCPRELLSMEVIDRIRWFVDQKNVANAIFQENHKIKDALSSIDLPETISSGELESQISWLISSFTQAKDNVVKLRDQVASTQLAVASHESELSEAHKEIDRLGASLMEVKQEKDSFCNEHEELRSKYEDTAGKLSLVSSEKNELMKVLLEVSGITLDDLPSFDTNRMVKKCLGEISERMKTFATEIEQFERMQSLLYVRDQESMLYENIIEEEMTNRSTMMRLSEELGRVSEEMITLRNEKYSLQKELERAEEKNSLLREKLSMAVKKGKGLVQEREGFKLSLDEKNSEIEKLKHELQLKDSAISECQEQIKSMSAYVEHIQKLESDVVSLRNEKDQCELLLLKNSSELQSLADSIDTIVLPTDNIFEGPVDKMNWIAEHVRESELFKAHKEQELEKIKKEATSQASRLVDALATIKSLEDAISHAEKNMSLFSEEKKDMQLDKASIEEELEKMKEDYSKQTRKLADATATIKSLEDALSRAENNISSLEAEKNEAESKSKQEIIALHMKLAECMEELAGARGNIENHSAEMNDLFEHLQKFIKDEALLSLMNEEFRKKIESLRNMGLLMQNLHDQFAAKGVHIHPGLELDPAFAKLLSLASFEDFIENKTILSEGSAASLDDFPSLMRIIEGLHAQAKLLRENFENLSKYMDEHIAVTVQALHTTSAEFIHLLELSESLKVDIDKLEAHNNAQKAKLVSLQKEMMALPSAFTEATEELQIDIHDLLNLNSTSGQGMAISSKDARPKDDVTSGIIEDDKSEFVKIAEHVLHAARRVKSQSEQLVDVKRVWLTSVDDLKHKVKQAELTAETAIQDQHLNQERVSTLERDLEALQAVCHEMKLQIENYQAKEDILRGKEQELLSLEHALTTTGRGTRNQLFSEGQVENLIDKVNKIKIPFSESETPSHGVHFSSPVDKLFYVIDNFSELQYRIDTLTNENEDMQLILETHVREIEHLKRAADAVDTNNQELESMKNEFVELTFGIERIIQRLGGNDSFEDQKATAKTLLPVLERLIIASTIEFEDSKFKLQDLGAKLQVKEKVVDELSTKLKSLEDSIHSRLAQPETAKERTVFEASSTSLGSEISEIEDVGPLGKNSIPPVSTAAHARTMRKGSSDHLVLNIDSESDRLISGHETDDKGHVFKSLNTSGLIPKQGKLIADRIDSIWVSGGRILMGRPGTRLGLIAYWIFLHLWLLGTIL